jgi:hypothetical protein
MRQNETPLKPQLFHRASGDGEHIQSACLKTRGHDHLCCRGRGLLVPTAGLADWPAPPKGFPFDGPFVGCIVVDAAAGHPFRAASPAEIIYAATLGLNVIRSAPGAPLIQSEFAAN